MKRRACFEGMGLAFELMGRAIVGLGTGLARRVRQAVAYLTGCRTRRPIVDVALGIYVLSFLVDESIRLSNGKTVTLWTLLAVGCTVYYSVVFHRCAVDYDRSEGSDVLPWRTEAVAFYGRVLVAITVITTPAAILSSLTGTRPSPWWIFLPLNVGILTACWVSINRDDPGRRTLAGDVRRGAERARGALAPVRPIGVPA